MVRFAAFGSVGVGLGMSLMVIMIKMYGWRNDHIVDRFDIMRGVKKKKIEISGARGGSDR